MRPSILRAAGNSFLVTPYGSSSFNIEFTQSDAPPDAVADAQNLKVKFKPIALPWKRSVAENSWNQ